MLLSVRNNTSLPSVLSLSSLACRALPVLHPSNACESKTVAAMAGNSNNMSSTLLQILFRWVATLRPEAAPVGGGLRRKGAVCVECCFVLLLLLLLLMMQCLFLAHVVIVLFVLCCCRSSTTPVCHLFCRRRRWLAGHYQCYTTLAVNAKATIVAAIAGYSNNMSSTILQKLFS